MQAGESSFTSVPEMKMVWVVRWWEEREKMKKHGRVKRVHEKASSIGPLITGDSKCCCVLAVLKPRWGAGDWQLCFTGSAGVWGHRERHYHLTTEELPQGSIKSRTGTCPCLPLEEFPSTLWLIHVHLLSFSSFLQKSVRMKYEIWDMTSHDRYGWGSYASTVFVFSKTEPTESFWQS